MSSSHDLRALVLIPSYNTGSRLQGTVDAALAVWPDVWVVVDGSDDGSDAFLDAACGLHSGLKVLRLERNGGKGAAVYHAAQIAREAGFTHMLSMDADGQHPADHIVPLLNQAAAAPDALVMGRPVFGSEVPKARLYGRKLTIFWTDLETLWCGLGDTLFGMRVYPLGPFCQAMTRTSFARGYDFDPEVAVRMVWLGTPPRQVEVPVRYFSEEEGGISHFHYLRDNLKLTGLQFRLMFAFVFGGLWRMLLHRRHWKART
ncbi:glycosyltransferase family 2 protein [Coraliomargarita parva]|uniref:glycosyltransferase family 2 protein n=1 Tax=Coraliomargarita parva TaxID=3014050 RepID=UPI0022B2C755|nr:glycosyltransferase family 2 protein [Coraliomargarita parva]